jgi:hypothetical protein
MLGPDPLVQEARSEPNTIGAASICHPSNRALELGGKPGRQFW